MKASNRSGRRLLTLCVLSLLLTSPLRGSEPAPEPALKAAVESDWAKQEQRWGRAASSPEALAAALDRTEKLLNGPESNLSLGIAERDRSELSELQRLAARPAGLDEAARLALYHRTRWLARNSALRDPSISGQPLVFMTRNRYICQMLHEYMGYFYDYGNVPSGGGVHILEKPGFSLATRDLIKGRLTGGNFTTLALSRDAQTLYFAFAERSEKKPDYTSPARKSFHIYAMSPNGSELRQLTEGVEDDFDPCPLPDGGIAFMSSRRGGFARCNNPWEPCASYTLHRMDADGQNIRRLSVHETSEWHPSVMNDGRLVYIRWDYVDRSAANFHGLWTSNPDGTAASALFGNYTMRINACYQPRPIPGSDKILFLAGAHHADVGGSLVLLDPKRVRFDEESGEDLVAASTEALTPEVCFPEAAGWPKSYFHSPWPLSESRMVVAFSFDPLPGMSSGEGKDTRTGLYYFDRFGNLELLYQDPQISCMYPMPLQARPALPTIVSALDQNLAASGEGEFFLADVNRSFFRLPEARSIRELRVFQLLPKGGIHTANEPRIGHANAENARMFLGSAPVEADGSACFRAPAGKPLYFQAVDGDGRAVQSMRSAVYLQPGERRSCVGCHEAPGSAALNLPSIAMSRPASRLTPGPEGTQPFSYPLLVQPLLDQHCVRCHDGQEGEGKSKLALTGEPAQGFTRSYLNLRPFLRWYEWGGESISQIATHPGQIGADASRLTAVLQDQNHRAAAQLPDAARRQLYLWLDGNVPFYGSYDKTEQVAQREGKPISPPVFQ